MRHLRAAAAIAAMITAMLLQATIVGPLTLPAPVSLVAVVVAAVALVDGATVGMAFGFVTGLVTDLGSDHPAGVLALVWLGLGLVCGMAATGRSMREDIVTAAVAAALASSLTTVLLAVVHSSGARPWMAVRDFVPALIGDALLALVVVPTVRRMLRSETLRAPHPVLTDLGLARRG